MKIEEPEEGNVMIPLFLVISGCWWWRGLLVALDWPLDVWAVPSLCQDVLFCPLVVVLAFFFPLVLFLLFSPTQRSYSEEVARYPADCRFLGGRRRCRLLSQDEEGLQEGCQGCNSSAPSGAQADQEVRQGSCSYYWQSLEGQTPHV